MNGRRIGCRCHWRFLGTVLSPSRAVKDAKAKHVSNLINSNSHCPGIPFGIINSVINPMSVALNDVSEPACDAVRFNILWTRFLQLGNPSHKPQLMSPPSRLFSFCDMRAVQELNATTCPLDIVPARIMMEAINTLGPCLVWSVIQHRCNVCTSLQFNEFPYQTATDVLRYCQRIGQKFTYTHNILLPILLSKLTSEHSEYSYTLVSATY